jgi:nitrate/nitrite-specific signal transduction histidine kinase
MGSLVVGYLNGRRQALDRLESIAARKELALQTWIDSLHNELAAALAEEYSSERATIVLSLNLDTKFYDFYYKALRARFQRYVDQSLQLEELLLLDLDGRVVLATNTAREGMDFYDQTYFKQGLAGRYFQLPFSSETTAPGEAAAIVVTPVTDEQRQMLGVLVGLAQPDELIEILREGTGLGRTGRAYLIDLNHIVLNGDHSLAAKEVRTTAIDQALENRTNGSGIYTDGRGVSVAGVYRWLPNLQMALVTEQELSEAFGAIAVTLAVNGSIALAAVLLAAGVSWLIMRSISSPLVSLAETATHIAAGDLERVARVERDDEVGALARAFNSMTAQLRDLISDLEQRVRARTQALRQRAVQLETSAQVSRQITSILDIDDLLARVVELIRAAFRYYHVHIYLVDAEANQLALRASSADVNPQRQRLAIGAGSLNGEAAQRNEALLVNDVLHDSRYLADDSLPDTRSELVVPLRVGDRLVGTLDVQSVEADAFTSEDVLVIQSLGDQIAIAIDNARLYRQARQVATLEERQRLARELHDSVTQSLYSLTLLAEGGRRLAHTGQLKNAETRFADLWEIARQSLKEMRLLVYELRPPVLEKEGLVGALQRRLDAVEGRAGVEARLLVDRDVALPTAVEEALYRIALEALNNALKHAAATALAVRIRCDGRQIELEVEDNGRGFDPQIVARGGGLGLTTMRERAEALGGVLSIRSAPEAGTSVKVTAEAPDG